MSDQDWHDHLVAQFGDAVPASEHLQIPDGFRPIIDDLFDALASYGHAIRVYSVIDRAEGLVVIDARFTDAATADEKKAINAILEDTQWMLSDV